jgi:hypothetical protein
MSIRTLREFNVKAKSYNRNLILVRTDQGWCGTMPLSPFNFWNNPTTSSTNSSNFFPSEFKDTALNASFTFCEEASHINFEDITKPALQSIRAPLPEVQSQASLGDHDYTRILRTKLVVDIPSVSPATATSPTSDNLPNLAATSMDVRSLHYPQRPWEMSFQAEALPVDYENTGWPDINSTDTGFSSNRSFFDFTASPIPPTVYSIPSPWPSEIYNWTTSINKLSSLSPCPSPEGFNDHEFKSPSASTSSISMPYWIQKYQDNVDPKPFLCIEECDRSVPGNGFSTKSNCATHWRRQHDKHCEKCSIRFTSTQLLKEHRKKVHAVILCPESSCPRSAPTNGFKLESQLKCHLKNYHDRAGGFLCNTTGADATVCEAHFSGKVLLQAHKRRVHRVKSNLCTKEGCPRSTSGNGFKLKTQLKVHLQTHPAK